MRKRNLPVTADPAMQQHPAEDISNIFSISGRKTPTHGGGSGSNGSKTPVGDRFIPNRCAMNFELGHYLVSVEHRTGSYVIQFSSLD